MSTPASTVRVTGPLAPFADGLREFLLGEGYTPLSAANVLRLAAHLSRWMQCRPAPLTPLGAEQFLRHRRRCGYTHFRSMRCLRLILSYLASIGAVAWPRESEPQPTSPVLQRYVAYLATERGLTASTVRQYATTAARFLATAVDVRRLTAADVTTFVLRESRRYSVGTTKLTVTVLRSLLRYLHVAGDIAASYANAVPPVAGWRPAGLPVPVAAADVAALLAACDRATIVGRRDYAVLLLLARLALRAVEAARLTLDDLRWADGEVVIRGKGSESRLPLPHDVGQALVAYVRGRGHTRVRTLFLRVRAPQRGLSATAITAIVRAAGRRARVAPIGPHRLRHAAATAMLRRGASLSQIAQVLRHRRVDTTAIYAKVDAARLRGLAQPWPGGCVMTELRAWLTQYLQIRRALGYKLERAGRLLPDFVTFLHGAHAPVITTALALAWATQPRPRGPWWAAERLSVVRGFARYVRALDGRTEIPPVSLLPHKRPRGTPYLYAEADVRALMDTARLCLGPFKGTTYRTLLGLLATTGLRVGEALALDHADWESADGVLRIRHAKFGKTRLVPVHPSTGAALIAYGRLRDRTFRSPRSPSFFVSRAGTRLHYKNVHVAFLRLLRVAGLTDRSPRRPRLHDFRHSFAMRTLRDWYDAGLDVDARLPWLSTYLGHIGPASTYWYLTATPELVTAAHRRLDHALEARS